MADISDIEKEFRISLSAPDFDVARGLEVAMLVEERGRKFYHDMMRKVSGQLAPFFKFLAEQEREHEATLGELKSSLGRSKLWIRVPASHVQEPLKDLSAFKKHPGNEYKDSSSDIAALLEAMQMENKTREFYLKFADASKSSEGRAFFRSLADWEKRHYELLSGLYNASSYARLET